MTDSSPIIVADGLGKSVPMGDSELRILKGISFSIDTGDSVAVTGVSGSGKSTLLGLLAGLDIPTEGSVRLLNHDLNALDEDQRALVRAKHVGFVFQSFLLMPNLSALENVMLPLEILNTKNAEQKASDLLARVNLGDRLDHYPRQLSGGEQQRVALARAFITEPDILFADEPTGNLDASTGDHVADLMFDLNKEHSTTLVLVTHDSGLAARCYRQIKMYDGQISDQ